MGWDMSRRRSVDVRRSNVRVHASRYEQQPWRCAECNTPVIPGRNMPCKCMPQLPVNEDDARITTTPSKEN